ncbi:MAG TPA: Hsp33 family molecular chaperone HslO, partial [Myxococcota bacterium]|nr:Hsp33 family molecular chaperone HslO [Myxococcota bacterium]
CLIDRARDAVLAVGRVELLFQAYREHAQRWEGKLPDDLALAMMRQALAATALHLAAKAPDEFSAWTLNVKQPPLNVFVTGDNTARRITGRVYTRDVKTVEESRLYFESQRPKRKPYRSVIKVEGWDVLDIFEQFYGRSEQLLSRLFELEDGRFLLVQGLPRVKRAWLAGLAREELPGYLALAHEPVETRTYTFECGCDAQKILQVVRGLFAAKPEELFRGDPRVEVQCPRCGRKWTIDRDEFGAGDARLGFS